MMCNTMNEGELYKRNDTQPLLFVDREEIVDSVWLEGDRHTPFVGEVYAQELLMTPILLENRIAHLIPYVEPTAVLMTAPAIAREIEASVEWVKSTAQFIGIEAIVSDDKDRTVYPPLSKELLEEEWAWYVSYMELDDWLSVEAIAQFVAKSERWVIWRANDLGIYREDRVLASKRRASAYPKTLIPQLRHIILSYPRSLDGYSVGELVTIFGEDWGWIKRRLGEAGLEPKETESITRGSILQYYPEESEAIIRKAIMERPPRAGDWLTMSGIALRLGKELGWVKSHINTELGMWLQDDTGKSALHYPPSEYQRLKVLVDEIQSYPRVDDELAVKAIAGVIHRSERWTRNHLPLTDFKPKKMRNIQNKIGTYYDKEVTDALDALPSDTARSSYSNKKLSVESIIRTINDKIAPDVRITDELIRQMRMNDSTIPSLTSVNKYFGSINNLNEQRRSMGNISDPDDL